MNILYFFIGCLAAIVGALPLGASNIAVIDTTLREDAKQSLKIAMTAGISEVVLAILALHFNMMAQKIVEANPLIEIIIIGILVVGTIYFFFKKSKERKKTPNESKYLTGFLTGILNPPVIIYWLIALNFINDHDFMLTLQSSLIVQVLFFCGVYFGKVGTLWAYGKFSSLIKNNVDDVKAKVNKATAIVLLGIGIFQTVKLYLNQSN